MEVISCIFLFEFADILGSDAKYKLFCLNLMHKVKTQRSGELSAKTCLFLNFFYMVIIKNYKVKKLFNKFPEIFRRINFRKFSAGNIRKFPNSQPC